MLSLECTLYNIDLFTGVTLVVVDNDNEHEKLARLLRQRIRDRTCVIDIDVSMGEAAKTSLIGLRKPDVILFKNINDERHLVVLIEVESSSSVLNTVNKLANGIMCQIIHLRNTGHTTNTLTGFFIPRNPGDAEEVIVTFNESLLRFDCTRNPMTRGRIITAIVQAWNNHKRILPLQHSLGLTFPISSELIRGRFSDRAFQVRSELSVVIHDPTNTLSWAMIFSGTYCMKLRKHGFQYILLIILRLCLNIFFSIHK